MEFSNGEMPDGQPVNFVREGLKIGLINGIFALVLMYGSYFVGLDTFVNVQFFSRFIPYMIIILVIYGLQLRKRNGDYLPFRQALQFSFMSYVIAGLVIAVGTYVLFNLVDKDLTKKSFDLAIEKMRNLLASTNQDQAKVDEQIEKMKASNQTTDLKSIVLGYGFGLIWDFVISLLVALVIRREKPAF